MSSPFASTGTPLYSEVIFKSRYARYLPEEGRREEWHETVTRYVDFFKNHITSKFSAETSNNIPWSDIYDAIYNLEVMPSMRALMAAGHALERDHVAGYNCAYLPIIDLRCFDEAMYILMCGTGVGFSVERQYINKLPEVPDFLFRDPSVVVKFEDSKEGWASGFAEFLRIVFDEGKVPSWDLSAIRPAGAPLKTFGGRASGPAPLDSLLHFTSNLMLKAMGRKLNSLECHDLMCKIAEVVVVGGVRRSALISLSNLTDARMRGAKEGSWYTVDPQRALSNNSVAYTEKPDMGAFLSEWTSLFESKSGERGIFSRPAARLVAGRNGRRDTSCDFGTNPCSEIILRPFQFCNLSEVVARHDDTLESLHRKVRVATIIGTVQSTLDQFRYIRREWADNAESERLLGVSITGIVDSHATAWAGYPLRDYAIEVNRDFAEILGIKPSVAITCVKPSGTVSQLVNSSSGLHPRYADFYIRRVRFDAKDPIVAFLSSNGVPSEPDQYNPSTVVFSFPIKSPRNALTRKEVSAVEQLRMWADWQDEWCEHKPSITVYVRDHEWLEVAAWVYENFDILSGVAFLPYDNGSYIQAPYEEIDEEEYNALEATMPKELAWTAMVEDRDTTVGSQELACTGGACEL